VRGGLALSLPRAIAERLGGRAGGEVTLGIRPEDVDERSAPRAGETLHGRVSSVLPVGSDQFLGFETEGKSLFFRVGRDLRYREGDHVALPVNTNRFQIFDPASGASLIW